MTKGFPRLSALCVLLSSLATAIASSADTTKMIDELTVIGLRQTEDLLKLPQSASVITAEEIDFYGAQSTAGALQQTGLLNVQKSQQGGGSPSIRGFEASRILLVVDGVKMNNLIYRAGHLQNLITVDPLSLERMEILYGPASVSYGSDALGGVIVMSTPDPVLSDKYSQLRYFGNATAGYNSVNNGTTLHADFNIGGAKFGSFSSVSFNRFGDLYSGREKNPFLPAGDSYIYRKYDVVHQDGKDVLIENGKYWHQPGSGYMQYDILQKFLWNPEERFTHLLNFQMSNSSDVPRYDRLTDMKSNGKPKFAQWYYGPQQRIMTSYSFKSHDWAAADEFSFILAYQNLKESRHNRKLDDAWLGSRYENVNVVSLSLDWIRLLGNHRLHAGIDGSLQFLKSSAYATDIDTKEKKNLDTRYPDGDNRMHNIDFFVSDFWTVSPQLTLTGALRVGYSYLRSEFISDEFYPFSSLIGTVRQDNPTYSLSVGAAYNPADNWKLGLNISTGYRVPNIDDLAKVFDSEPGNVVMPNPAIRPEQTVSADLNVATYDNEKIYWTAALFGTYMFDAISLQPALFDGKPTIDYDGEPSRIYSNHNSRRAYVIGASSSLNVTISTNFGANANLTYTYGNYLKNKGVSTPLDHVAPLYGKVGLTFASNCRRVKAEFYSLFNARKPASRYNPDGEDNAGYATQFGMDGNSDFEGMPAWFTLNLMASYSPVRNLTIQGGIENILNTEYRVFGSGINAPGRNFMAALRVNF